MNSAFQLMIRKLKANIPKMTGSFITPEKAREILAQAVQFTSVQQQSFEWVFVDRPQDGTVYVCQLNKEQSLNFTSDGYGWLDDEQSTSLKLDGLEIEVRDRSFGFDFNDRLPTIKRRRIRIMQPGLTDMYLVHYLRLDPQAVTPQTVRQMPRAMQATAAALATSRAQQQSFRPSPYQARPQPVMNYAALHQQQQQQANQYAAANSRSYRKPPASQPKNYKVKVVEHESFQGGGHIDDLDMSIDSKVASERFRRNQEWMEEIFSSFHTVAPTVVDLDKVSEWTEQKEVLQNEISQIKFKYQQHLDSFKNNSQVLHEAIEELPSLSGTELDAQLNHVATKLKKVAVPPQKYVKMVEIN